MKKTIALALALLALLFCGCGGAETEKTPEPTVAPTATPEPTPPFMTSLTYKVDEATYFTTGDEANPENSFAPGTYRIFPAPLLAGENAAAWVVYTAEELYANVEDIPEDCCVGEVGGESGGEVTVTVLEGDYIFLDYIAPASGRSGNSICFEKK